MGGGGRRWRGRGRPPANAWRAYGRIQEQQIQRYEATDYASADFARLSEIARALGVRVREDLFLNETLELSEERLKHLNERVRQTVVAYLEELRRAG
jgi:hypothetical protein